MNRHSVLLLGTELRTSKDDLCLSSSLTRAWFHNSSLHNFRDGIVQEALRRNRYIFTPEQRKKGGENLTPEHRRQLGVKTQAVLTPEQLRKNLYRTPEQRKEDGRKGALVVNASLTPEQRREKARKASQVANKLLTSEQRSTFARKARLAAGRKPNGSENQMIAILKNLGMYAAIALTAPKGHVYYADSLANKRWIRLSDGRTAIPDFKVKGMKKVIEIYGDYWHSKKFCESKGFPAYKWDAALMEAEYAKVGYACFVLWESEVCNLLLRERIKGDILAFVAMDI